MHSVLEYAALGMVPRLNQLKSFTSSQNFLLALMETPDVNLCQKPRSWIFPNQLRNRRSAITGDLWENLFGNRENVAYGLVRESIVENSSFVRSWRKALHNEGSRCALQVMEHL